MGKKGQITIPKRIRDEDKLKEDDVFVLTHLHGGCIVLKKAEVRTSEDKLLEIIKTVPRFDWRQAWEEVK